MIKTFISAAALLAVATAAHADELSDVQAQAKQLREQMTRRLADLEKRQKALEQQQKAAAPAINPVDAMAADLPYKAAVKAKPPENDDICIKGICVYGNFDMGVSYIQHGAPLSSVAAAPLNTIISKNSNGSYFGTGPDQMSNSFIGLRGKQEIADNLYAVFNLQTLFNVNSGMNASGIGSVAQNNGLTTNLLAQTSIAELVEGRSDVQQRGLFRYQFADLRYLHHGPSKRPELGPPRQLRSVGRLKLLVAAHLPGCERRWR